MNLPDTYQNAVACGQLQPDPAQEAALFALERLRLALSQPRKRGWFRKAAPAPDGVWRRLAVSLISAALGWCCGPVQIAPVNPF